MMSFCPTFITERKKSAVGLLSFTRDLKSLNKEIARSTCDVIDGSQFIFVRWITELIFYSSYLLRIRKCLAMYVIGIPRISFGLTTIPRNIQESWLDYESTQLKCFCIIILSFHESLLLVSVYIVKISYRSLSLFFGGGEGHVAPV